MASQCQVRVGVRIRPVTSQEIKQGGKQVLDVVPPSVGIGERRFTYDAVFDSHVTQQELYDNVSKPLLGSFVDGYNATIMAYGQTGSGKTFTMGSEAHSEPESLSHAGLIPRFLADIFEQLQRMKEVSHNHELGQGLVNYKISASFLEVYGEDVHDLLDRDRKSLPLREDSNGGIVIAGLTNRPVSNATEVLEVLHEGTMNRTTAATLMNLTSSRSHAVFTIHLTQTTRSGTEGDVDVTTTSQFTFVDLAGSERMKKTGAEGERAKEGIKINEGLLALGNVINALADEERLVKEKKVHVPYRQSKLTRLLQDALGGNSQTLFLACVSPSDTNASETLSTLHYANRARNIKNAPTRNVDATILELKRLKALTRVLQCELIKSKFGEADPIKDGEEKIGEVESSLMNRNDVIDYIKQLHDAAEEEQESSTCFFASNALSSAKRVPAVSNMEFPAQTPGRQLNNRKSDAFAEATPNKSILDRFDDSLLDEVNPDAEMAILDQLLEVQSQDQNFRKEQSKGTEELKIVEGELAEQEALLLQLRESLRVYHNMKDKYEALMAEVQQLETEKEHLAEQLEKAKADPSKGCSASIKRKLEKVEQNLSRARSETRKHRQMYRKAEQEAQKCKALERKITELKQGRVALMKKQREAAARHKEYTDAKTREITALKRKERNTEKRVSKLQSEIQIHKTNLEKRKNYCDKLSQKLQQTESHLMKLLAMRNKEFHDRRSSVVGFSRRRSTFMQPTIPEHQEAEETFAPVDEEVKSIKFLLEKVVSDKVNRSELKQRYEETVAEYSELMRQLVTEMKALEHTKRSTDGDDSSAESDSILELEQNVEDLELRVELLGSDLEEIRSKLPGSEDNAMDTADESDSAMDIVSGKSAPILRTLLLETVEKYSEAELQRRRLSSAIQRKDYALESLENEVDTLNNRIAGLTNDLTRRRKLSGENTVEMVQSLEQEKTSLEQQLSDAQKNLDQATTEINKLKNSYESLGEEHASVKEKLTLAEVIARQNSGVHPAEGFLEKAQELWEDLGVELSHRESIRLQIESCLEDTCSRKLEEESALKEETSTNIDKLQSELLTMRSALGTTANASDDSYNMKLLKRLDWLKKERENILPALHSAIERREKISKDVEELASSMRLGHGELSEQLQTLLHEDNCCATEDNDANAKVVYSDLSNAFLSKCEEEVSSLRLKKARILVRNTEVRSEAHKLVQEMNLSADDLVNLSLHSIRQRRKDLPGWWDQAIMGQVAHCVVESSGVINATQSFSNHLEVIFESLDSVSNGRRQISSVLRDIVKRAQKTLLDIVEGEIDASEAYASFHDVLFRLPPLSKEFVEACISEIETLITGVEAMAQSEIEALTVVWEALNVSMKNRGKFWSEIDESTKAIESNAKSPFDEVLRTCALDTEQWVLTAVNNSRSSYKKLETRLFRLERIHQEVEKRRSSQDSKSRIISLDSELRILSARLADFEDKKCSKQRLLTKKSGSSALLKEERFRKQMQGKYASTLEQLAGLLKTWKYEEGTSFDPNLLSDEVRSLLKDSVGEENWVEKRTEFMHLRTTKTATKRKPERPTQLTPPRKKHIKPNNIPRPDAGDTALGKRREARTTSSTCKPRPLEPTTAFKKRKTETANQGTEAASNNEKGATLATKGFAKSPPRRKLLGNKRESATLMPFGKVLLESPGSPEKENSHSND